MNIELFEWRNIKVSNFSNVVRFCVKDGCEKDFEHLFDAFQVNNGETNGYLINTNDKEYIYVGIWESEDALVSSRAKMIEDLDKMRDMLEEISSDLGVTDPRSGNVVWSHS